MPAMTSSSPVDARLYRDAIGRFATGVTVVTVDDGVAPRGMTANAVSSVSLDPVLLLVCVAKSARSHQSLESARAFAVNVLTVEQRELSDYFARSSDTAADPMGSWPYRRASTGAPVLEGALAWFDCRVTDWLPGGDHSIVIGEVVDMAVERPDAEPLLFHAGAYRRLGESL
jgi:flavin reductase (DIM6/NTAB) family NADH-FMN oxidoreductase RutF